MAQTATNTGTRDVTYNLVSVMYHALQGAENYSLYANDAEQAGEKDLAQFFREVMEDERKRADRAKVFLARRLNSNSK